jgi:ArsR family transcriptional regulator, arsenate/arsenite/antimonite-responsive transcriptional repressor / arsenate reductase (thioredoxin)
MTNQSSASSMLKLLADDTRWQLIAELRRSDLQAGELGTLLKLPQNLVSYHLGMLRQAGLVQAHRSDADARAVYYSLDLAALGAGYAHIGAAMQLPYSRNPATQTAATVFFLCTQNSARSQMAEGWLRHLSSGRIPVRSAGIAPQALHPLALQVMAEAGVDIGYQQAKGLDALADVIPNVVVTVCDLAREQCPEWSDSVNQLHWSIPDPVRIQGDPETQAQTFRAVRDDLRQRVEGLLALLPDLTSTHRT